MIINHVFMDIELGENGNFYKDKMMFIPTEAFSEQMDILIEGIFTQIVNAKQAALAYYEDTVFYVNSIEYLEGELPYGDMEGGCNSTVNVSRGGVVQEPNRTISLQPDGDGWQVVNEGY